MNRESWSIPPLRDYQRAAVQAWRDAGDRGVIVLPTGAGKTIVALAAIAELAVSTLVLVPTRILLDQWARFFGMCWAHPIGRLGDGQRSIAPITIATYASAITWAPRIGDSFGLVVVDEAHHVGAWCPREILEMLVAPSRLGLTATPPDGVAASALARHVGPTVFECGIADLTGTALAPYTHETIAIELTAEERSAYRSTRGLFAAYYARARRDDPNMHWRQFVHEAQKSDDGREAVLAWRASRTIVSYPEAKRSKVRELLARHAGDRVLVFTADNATAYAISRELLVPPITCDIRRKERTEMLSRFSSGACNVLVSAQVLDEGFDIPDADVAIVVGGTSSQRRQVQRIGRVLRPRPGKHAVVYELVVEGTAEVRQSFDRATNRSHRGARRHPEIVRQDALSSQEVWS
ncbi:MAG TPA: DEAD/DEAH box helicase [Kofleriaceae bacterium]|nr:DEAD/DEAH box helicase [Kofleriaceae bacterium]